MQNKTLKINFGIFNLKELFMIRVERFKPLPNFLASQNIFLRGKAPSKTW